MDMLLTDAGVSGVGRWLPGRAGVKAATQLALRPDRVARRGAGLARESARIWAGRSEVAPDKGDRRFKDPAWQGNPAFARLIACARSAARSSIGRAPQRESQKSITLRMPSWASISSNPRLTSSRRRRCEISGATSISPCR